MRAAVDAEREPLNDRNAARAEAAPERIGHLRPVGTGVPGADERHRRLDAQRLEGVEVAQAEQDCRRVTSWCSSGG